MNFREEFAQIIEDIEVGQYTSREEVGKAIHPMLQFIEKNLPEQLFKFRGCTEYSFDAFAKDELWLSKASLFNDLHDSLFFFNKENILNKINEMCSSGNEFRVAAALKETQNSLKHLQIDTPETRQRISSILSSLDEKQLIDMMQLAIPDFGIFLDQCFSEIKESIRNKTKMVCLSESIKSPLMWAHYADNNRGFALGYDFRNNEISQCSNCPNRSCNEMKQAVIYPIIYSDKRFDATDYGRWYVEQRMNAMAGILQTPYGNDFLFVKAALHKSKDWEYESEWRIICSTPNPAIESKDRYPIKKQPVAIYFGCQISDIYKKILSQIADEKGLAKYQMYVKNYSDKYELDYDPI